MANQEMKINKIKASNGQEYEINATYWGGKKLSEIKPSDFGLSSVLKYCGITTTPLEDGSAITTVIIDNKEHKAEIGCVVFYENEEGTQEFVYNGSKWELIGKDLTYKVVQDTVSSPNISGYGTAFIDTISQDANGVITATKKYVNIPTPDWNAQEGEAGYIENKPFAKISLFGYTFVVDEGNEDNPLGMTNLHYDVKKTASNIKIQFFDSNHENIIFDKTINLSDAVGSTIETVKNTHLGDFDISLFDYDDNYVLVIGGRYEELWNVSIQSALQYFNIEEITCLNDLFIPDSILKTTPQSLSDADKNQALANLGIKDKIDKLLNITYLNLKSLRDNSQLVPCQQYRITDYVTTTIQSDTQSAGHQFDIIVIADDVNVLNENARAIQHEGDTYFSNSDLNAWELKYCLDNDTERFAWADAENGKGVIYRMIDEWGNDCPYDFKNIQFKRNLIFDNGFAELSEDGDETWVYTFAGQSYHINNDEYSGMLDGSLESPFGHMSDEGTSTFHDNVIKSYMLLFDSENEDNSVCGKAYLNDNVFLGYWEEIGSANDEDAPYYYAYCCHNNSLGDNCSSNSFGNGCSSNSFGNGCRSNSFGNDCYSNSFGNDCYYNSFGNNCYSNSFGNDCYYNSFGNNCYYNSFGIGCYYNSFGDDCSSNSFGDGCNNNSLSNRCGSNSFDNDCHDNIFEYSCNYNVFGKKCFSNSFSNSCGSNSFGNSCSSNSFGNYCDSNSLGEYCYYNSFGNGCSNNSFGNSCYRNSFGESCSNNSFGNSCSSNSFGNSCDSNSFGNSCYYNSFGESRNNLKSYYRYIIFDNGNRYINLNCTTTTSSSKYFQNVRIGLGVNNTTTFKTINDSNVNQKYETLYKPANSQTITI